MDAPIPGIVSVVKIALLTLKFSLFVNGIFGKQKKNLLDSDFVKSMTIVMY